MYSLTPYEGQRRAYLVEGLTIVELQCAGPRTTPKLSWHLPAQPECSAHSPSAFSSSCKRIIARPRSGFLLPQTSDLRLE